ncbi:hypothetical protein BKA67DRAFT_538997 [Truncatella angustata]|uniref:Uncharacterized protein n=1 Tax=Truncatella angustata TaxID=152316 RepID=A0A9P8UFR0_9PEZI|nr:uncharacterized protein BKA67DRAFT_538997 [Truncatella angustata]KAH6648993.1 hypothetical protein BKA67DRAFT_538997 [Truncatella angustata]
MTISTRRPALDLWPFVEANEANEANEISFFALFDSFLQLRILSNSSVILYKTISNAFSKSRDSTFSRCLNVSDSDLTGTFSYVMSSEDSGILAIVKLIVEQIITIGLAGERVIKVASNRVMAYPLQKRKRKKRMHVGDRLRLRQILNSESYDFENTPYFSCVLDTGL